MVREAETEQEPTQEPEPVEARRKRVESELQAIGDDAVADEPEAVVVEPEAAAKLAEAAVAAVAKPEARQFGLFFLPLWHAAWRRMWQHFQRSGSQSLPSRDCH